MKTDVTKACKTKYGAIWKGCLICTLLQFRALKPRINCDVYITQPSINWEIFQEYKYTEHLAAKLFFIIPEVSV